MDQRKGTHSAKSRWANGNARYLERINYLRLPILPLCLDLDYDLAAIQTGQASLTRAGED